MPKLKRSLLIVKGKIGDMVAVDSKTYGYHLRKAIKPGLKKDEPALQQQYKRTAYLNGLAGELNTIIAQYAGAFKGNNFYHQLLRQFRKEPKDDRFLLLQTIKGIEINDRYPLNRLTDFAVTVKKVKIKLEVNLSLLHHPLPAKGSDCYFLETLLLCWNKSSKPARHASQWTEWIYYTEQAPVFKLNYPCSSDCTHWLFCIRQKQGAKEKELERFAAEGMQIIAAGSFDKREPAITKKIKHPSTCSKKGTVAKNIKRVKRSN